MTDFWLIIGVGGVSCSGKTTLALALHDFFSNPVNATEFKENIKIESVKMINQDDYFLAVDNVQHTWIEKLNHINWEILNAIDMEKMSEDISNVLGSSYRSYNSKRINEENTILLNDLSTTENNTKVIPNTVENNPRKYNTTAPISLNILIIEGFLIFNNHYTLDLCDVKFHLHLPYEKCFDRRKNRIYDPPDVTGYFEMCVWPMYETHFKEIKDRNDIIKLNGDIKKEKIFNYVVKCIQNIL